MMKRQGSGQRWRKTFVNLMGPGYHPYLTVPGYLTASAPGLVAAHNTQAGHWSVTHVASGYAIGPRCYSLRSAKDVLLMYAPLADWTKPADVIWADLKLCRKASKLRHSLESTGVYLDVAGMPAREMPEPARRAGEGEHSLA